MKIGTRLNHYTILSAIGKGGMGEVWKAKDTTLGREVAIKTLPEEFSKDADRLARFEREARLLASLNHPNIAAIHGFEEDNGTHFLIMELVEGDTVADRLQRRAIPVEESLKLALQITEALEAAHGKGVVHRDLKPANIKVTADGNVKVLDFGLARAFARDQREVSASNSPTLSMSATQQGVILGTAAYMSPEQARGETTETRTDVWSFGCVLFEMLTRQPTWRGRTVTDIIGGIVALEPDWTVLPPNLHPRLRLLLERCLEKEPKDRYQGIGDARVDIQSVLDDPSGVIVQPVAAAGQSARQSKLWWVAAVVGVVVTGVAVWTLKPEPLLEPAPIVKFEHQLPDELTIITGRQSTAVSPDGRQIVVYTSAGLYVLSVDEFEGQLIPGTEGPKTNLTFSPDGQWVAYWAVREAQLRKISVNGGPPVRLADVLRNPSGISWSPDDTIVFSEGGILKEISGNGGLPETLPGSEGAIRAFPQVLPGGRSLLFTQYGGDEAQVGVFSFDSGENQVLFAGNTARYVPTGHIIYFLEGSLYARPFDLETLAVGGGFPVGEGLRFAVSDSGTLAYISGVTSGLPQRTLVLVDREGREESINVPTRAYLNARLSPDGTRMAVDIRDEETRIWMWEVTRPTLEILTFELESN